MARKDTLKGQLADRSNDLAGALNTLVRGSSREGKPVGRPRKDEDVIHTSLVIDRELYKRLKSVAVSQGRDVKGIINEAVESWLAKEL